MTQTFGFQVTALAERGVRLKTLRTRLKMNGSERIRTPVCSVALDRAVKVRPRGSFPIVSARPRHTSQLIEIKSSVRSKV